MSECTCPDCVAHHPPEPPSPGRPGWTVEEHGGTRWHRVLVASAYLAVLPPRDGAGFFWLAGGATGRASTLEDAQLAAERAAIPLLRAAADELARGLPEACGRDLGVPAGLGELGA